MWGSRGDASRRWRWLIRSGAGSWPGASAGRVIDCTGLVVSPGFIDIHTHEGVLPKSMECYVLDGRTTMVGGNCGGSALPISDLFAYLKANGCLVNFASYVGHQTLRLEVGVTDRYAAASPSQIAEMERLAAQELAAGALGVSYGINYTPGAPYEELLALAKVAAAYGGLTAAHARASGISDQAVAALAEMIQLAKDVKVPHEFSHIGSMLGFTDWTMEDGLELIDQAQAEGVRISADIYSFGATSTGLGSAILDGDFFGRYDCVPNDIEVVNTVVMDGVVVMPAHARFESVDQFNLVRGWVLAGTIPDPYVICHIIKNDMIRMAMENEYVMCGSDGMVSFDPITGLYTGHPRTAGNYGRFFGFWVREQGLCDLSTAIFKASTQPALTLGLKKKGRIQQGCDADITVFDPNTIAEGATFGPGALDPSLGIPYVVVNGAVTVDEGELVPGVMAGQPILRDWKVPGYSSKLVK